MATIYANIHYYKQAINGFAKKKRGEGQREEEEEEGCAAARLCHPTTTKPNHILAPFSRPEQANSLYLSMYVPTCDSAPSRTTIMIE